MLSLRLLYGLCIDVHSTLSHYRMNTSAPRSALYSVPGGGPEAIKVARAQAFLPFDRLRELVSTSPLVSLAVVYHGLRGSASPVLTATGFVNGRCQFSTPTESTPLDRSPKNLAQVITSAAPTAASNLVQIRRWGASGQMGEI